MKALLLAAGFGKRLRPLTDTIPKPLVPVNGVPLILYNLALLKVHGIKDIVINLHYLGHKIPQFLGNGAKIGFTIRYSREPEILGTGGGIRKTLPLFKDEEAILVMNSDIITDVDLSQLIKQHRKEKPVATLVLRQHREAAKFGLLHYKKCVLESILGKPIPPKSASAAHFTGIHVLQKDPLRALSPQKESCIVQNYYVPKLVAGEPLGAFAHKGYWNDCGTLDAVRDTSIELGRGKIKLGFARELNALIKKLS